MKPAQYPEYSHHPLRHHIHSTPLLPPLLISALATTLQLVEEVSTTSIAVEVAIPVVFVLVAS